MCYEPSTIWYWLTLLSQQGFLTSGPVTLVSSQQTGSSDQTNSASLTYPSGAWPIGHGFQINFMSTQQNNNAILAQSMQFNITSGGSSGMMATSSGTPPMTLTNNAAMTSTSSTGSMSTASYTGNAMASGSASGIIPNAVSMQLFGPIGDAETSNAGEHQRRCKRQLWHTRNPHQHPHLRRRVLRRVHLKPLSFIVFVGQ